MPLLLTDIMPFPAPRLTLLAALLAVLAAGCATTSTAPSRRTAAASGALQIDGLTIDKLLASDELKRIDHDTPEQYRGDVISSEALGKVVYAHDSLATAAGELVAPGGRSTLGYPAAGWITERTPEGLRVIFIVKLQQGLGIAAEVNQAPGSGKPQLHTLSPPRALTPTEEALWQARQLAFNAHFKPCAKHYNPVVIPISAQGNGAFYVYLLPVSADPGLIFLGGYYRITVNADGSRILDTHAFTHACVTLHRNPKATGAGVSELMSPTPTPPQVYASLRYGLPVYVATATNSVVWNVKDGRIYYVRTVKPD
ncbi:MAG: hypothetical protein ACRES7_01305 [Gammaproteobacteria bacterium]